MSRDHSVNSRMWRPAGERVWDIACERLQTVQVLRGTQASQVSGPIPVSVGTVHCLPITPNNDEINKRWNNACNFPPRASRWSIAEAHGT